MTVQLLKSPKDSSLSLQEILRNELLPQVQKPGQYLGTEWGAFNKDWDSAKSRMALIYPDLYELGMSNFGLKILYNIVNNHPDYLCDRAYAPMRDMEDLLKERDLPLWGWESFKPLGDFDMIGFSFGYELCYTNVLTMFDLCQIPFESKDRTMDHPLCFAGGPATFNPEPMADFLDFYLIGDGEELIIEIQDVYLKARDSGLDRQGILLELSKIQGVYVPSLYAPDEAENYLPKPVKDLALSQVRKRVAELNDLNQPTIGPVPTISAVQDKQTMEIRRGCDRGCRFCQPGYIYLPVRERSPEELLNLSTEALANTGYQDYSLLSLSASDYTCLTDAARAMNDAHSPDGISLSMPSQRADRFNVELASEIQKVRKSGVTLAPEAGTERMRRIVNKGLRQEEIYTAIRNVYNEGWDHVKLYFMIGLPFEEDEDLDGILDILSWSINMAKQARAQEREELKEQIRNDESLSEEEKKSKFSRLVNLKYPRELRVTCTISTFVPKSFTPFQWFPQCSTEEFARKQKYLQDGLRERGIARNIKLNCTEPDLAIIESVLSRADRRWGKVIKSVWDSGCRLDAWSENFKLEKWDAAAKLNGLDIYEEVSKDRPVGSKQPWDVLDIGFTDKFLIDEWKLAEEESETPACTENSCHACGVCFNLDVKNVVTENRSDKNPFVIEIDKERRQTACASLASKEGENSALSGESQGLTALPEEELSDKQLPAEQSPALKEEVSILPHSIVEIARLVISKTGDLRFIGHLDFQNLIIRALRRAKIPVVYTSGFNQHMKIRFSNPLPLFVESEWEYLEIELACELGDPENFKDILERELPKQVRIKSVDLRSTDDKSSINEVLEAEYHVNSLGDKPISQQEIDEFLALDTIEIKKSIKSKNRKTQKLKTKNIRNSILAIELISPKEMKIRLKSTQRADEVLRSFRTDESFRISKSFQRLA